MEAICHSHFLLFADPDPTLNSLERSLMSHKLSITQLTSPANATHYGCAAFFSLPLFDSFFHNCSSKCPPPSPPRIHWLSGHFFFSSHNATLILNMEPTVVGQNEWPNHSASISPSIIADWRTRRGVFIVTALCGGGGRTEMACESFHTGMQSSPLFGHREPQSGRQPCPVTSTGMPSKLHHLHHK